MISGHSRNCGGYSSLHFSTLHFFWRPVALECLGSIILINALAISLSFYADESSHTRSITLLFTMARPSIKQCTVTCKTNYVDGQITVMHALATYLSVRKL